MTRYYQPPPQLPTHTISHNLTIPLDASMPPPYLLQPPTTTTHRTTPRSRSPHTIHTIPTHSVTASSTHILPTPWTSTRRCYTLAVRPPGHPPPPLPLPPPQRPQRPQQPRLKTSTSASSPSTCLPYRRCHHHCHHRHHHRHLHRSTRRPYSSLPPLLRGRRS